MMQGPSNERSNVIVFPFPLVTRRRAKSRAAHERPGSQGNPAAEASNANAMFVLGQIGAIICHEPGPRPETAILTVMASRPAEALWLAVARLNESSRCARGDSAALLERKRQAIARLCRLLPHPLPCTMSGETQMSFWAGYCAYWNEILKAHADCPGKLAS